MKKSFLLLLLFAISDNSFAQELPFKQVKLSDSRGYNAEEEIWLYAPAVKTFIKLTQSQGDFLYVEELIEYSKPN